MRERSIVLAGTAFFDLYDEIKSASSRTGVDPFLLAAIIEVEDVGRISDEIVSRNPLDKDGASVGPAGLKQHSVDDARKNHPEMWSDGTLSVDRVDQLISSEYDGQSVMILALGLMDSRAELLAAAERNGVQVTNSDGREGFETWNTDQIIAGNHRTGTLVLAMDQLWSGRVSELGAEGMFGDPSFALSPQNALGYGQRQLSRSFWIESIVGGT